MNAKIVIEVPEHLKGLVEPVRTLIRGVEAHLDAAGRGRSVEYGKAEVAVRADLLAVERAAHGVLLRALEVDAPRVEIGGERYSRVGKAPGTYYTMAGAVEVERALYRRDGCRNAPTVDAISLRTGAVGRGWLPHAASAMAQLLQQGTSREAEQIASVLGCLPYSRASFDRVPHELARTYMPHKADIEDELIEEQEIPKGARSISLALDRVSVPMAEPVVRPVGRPRTGAPTQPILRQFRMAYCGTLTLHGGKGRSLHTIRYGCMPNADETLLVERMATDAHRLLTQRPGLRLTLLADGAHEMWDLLQGAVDVLRLKALQVVDFWHVIEKLSPAAALIYGAEETRGVLGRWKRMLRERPQGAAAILRELEVSGCEHTVVAGKQPVHEAITYLRNNAERVDYPGARRRGLPIGSGNVEATCKTLVGIRMKRCGSRWKEPTGDHVLQLRALALSDRLEPALAKLFAIRRTSVRRAA